MQVWVWAVTQFLMIPHYFFWFRGSLSLIDVIQRQSQGKWKSRNTCKIAKLRNCEIANEILRKNWKFPTNILENKIKLKKKNKTKPWQLSIINVRKITKTTFILKWLIITINNFLQLKVIPKYKSYNFDWNVNNF